MRGREGFAGLGLVAALLASGAAGLQAQTRAPAAAAPKAETLTRAQFDALRDDDVIDVGGRQVAKREVVATLSRMRAEGQARSAAALRQAEAQHQMESAAFDRGEQARLQQENARARAEFVAVQGGRPPAVRGSEPIRAEAAQLRARAARATSEAEMTAIQLRARQLLDQLGRP